MQANLGNMIKKVKTPSVSIVMGVRNAESTIEKTISSILNQANESLELIIVNDGSTDSTETIIRKINQEDNRIKCVTRKNKGLTISLIEGCELAQGEFIARHDANDLSVPGSPTSLPKATNCCVKPPTYCSASAALNFAA